MTVLAPLLIIAGAVLIGTVLQRVSGSGVGLVVAPVLSILLGPGLGVLITNMTTMVSGFLIMLAVWPRIDWARYRVLGPVTVIGAIPGAWLVGQLSAGWLSIILGAIVLCALLFTVTLPQLPRWEGRATGVVGGILGGFFNTTSGVAAPVMVIYSRLSRWDQQAFAATMQPLFLTMGTASVVTKLLVGSVEEVGQTGALHLGVLFPGIVVTVLLGILLGGRLARIVSPAQARTVALALAGLGALGALARGTVQVLGG
ncbi:TSUP family transporter [Nesterenkonia suensis]